MIMKKINNKLINKIIKYLVCVAILYMAILSFYINENVKDKNSSVLYLFKNTSWKKLGKAEGAYTAYMYDVLNTMSSESSHSSMTKEMRIKYTTENFKLAREFGYGYYDVTIIGFLETDMNPHAGSDVHLHGEVGMFGQMPGTAKRMYRLAKKIMPTTLWRLVRFEFNEDSDLHDPINSLKMTYMFLYIAYKIFEVENWAIGWYHFGKWIDAFWFDGMKLHPIKFTFYTEYGKRTVNCKSYYFTWKKIKTNLENGKIDIAKTIYNKYKKKRDKLKYEEIEYRRAVSVIKSLEKKIKNYEQVEVIRKKELTELKVECKKAKRVMREVGRLAKEEGWTERNTKWLVDICKKTWQKFKSIF